ncbi:YybH family protein [Burkholderia sp. BCC1988]|uniref:YybH family protein n=1 Tax=Burkholderia sp. BCC1988 TaxID=2817443 RepID=UPI0039F09C45
MVTQIDDEQDVRDLFERYIRARNSGDVDSFADCFDSGATCFYRNGAPLRPVQGKDERRSRYQNGYKAAISATDITVRTFDGAFAIVTSTIEGSVVNPDGTTESGPWRLSASLRKQTGGWVFLHLACSRLMANATIPT